MRRAARRIALSLAAICLSCPAHAIDPIEPFRNTLREWWSTDRGFSGASVTAVAQTSDGYLWIGTQGSGPVRRHHVSPVPQATPATFPIGPVQALMVGLARGLWIILQSTQILRYSNGNFELGHDEAEFGITSIARLKTVRSPDIARPGTTAISCQPVPGSHLFRIVSRDAERESDYR